MKDKPQTQDTRERNWSVDFDADDLATQMQQNSNNEEPKRAEIDLWDTLDNTYENSNGNTGAAEDSALASARVELESLRTLFNSFDQDSSGYHVSDEMGCRLDGVCVRTGFLDRNEIAELLRATYKQSKVSRSIAKVRKVMRILKTHCVWFRWGLVVNTGSK